MTNYREILRLDSLGLNKTQIADACDCSRTTVIGHDNASDAYTVSEQWDEKYLLKNKDGSFYKMDVWSSGRAYKICPQRYYELFASEHFEKVRELGFEGIHYIDVITILTLLECHDKNHPLTRKQAVEWYKKLMEKARSVFGGFSSESGSCLSDTGDNL